MTTILALDLAYAKPTGWSLWREGKYVSSDTCDYTDHMTRSSLFFSSDIDVVYYESTAYRGTAYGMGRALGLWEAVAQEYGVPLIGIPSSKWRKMIFGVSERAGRSALKRMSIEWCREQLGVECGDDEADAICIGYCADYLSRVAAGETLTDHPITRRLPKSTSQSRRLSIQTGTSIARPRGSRKASSSRQTTASTATRRGSGTAKRTRRKYSRSTRART